MEKDVEVRFPSTLIEPVVALISSKRAREPMDTKIEVHVSLHYVLPPEERDVWNDQPWDTRVSWRPMTGHQDQVGEPTEYVALLAPEEVDRFNAARNCRYAVPAVEAHAHGDPSRARKVYWNSESYAGVMGRDGVPRTPVPSPSTLAYHLAEEAEDYADGGEGVVYFHLDTGASNRAIQNIGALNRCDGWGNFTGQGDVTDASDGNGHGSMTISLLLPKKAHVRIFKVLGDNGGGSSSGIVRAIRECANIASADPSKKYILSGSLGGPPGQRFQPYVDACAAAESFGVLCRWSAGNDGQGKISAPANWREDRASIAYNLPGDHIADFSNHGALAGSATHGEAILTYDKDGNLVEVDGTSFSLPLWNRFTGIVASMQVEGSVFDVNAAELATGRDTPGSVQQEPHGVLDVGRTRSKLAPPAPPVQPVDPSPEPPKPEDPAPPLRTVGLAEFEDMHPDAIRKLHAVITYRRQGRLGTFKGVEVEETT